MENKIHMMKTLKIMIIINIILFILNLISEVAGYTLIKYWL